MFQKSVIMFIGTLTCNMFVSQLATSM
uniref:Uncharacterized protein n=1 Tax=Anguilla anguilla TaxID=7936 RepID=A0A0E9VP54_ANGAN